MRLDPRDIRAKKMHLLPTNTAHTLQNAYSQLPAIQAPKPNECGAVEFGFHWQI